MTQHAPEPTQILFDNPFLQIRTTTDGYVFLREARCDGQIVALLPYRRKAGTETYEYLARFEVCPAHGREHELCSITGGKDPEHSLETTALCELQEEAGYTVSLEELLPLGCVKPSKAADTRVSLFAVDLTGKPQGVAQTDGSKFEQDATVVWVDYARAVAIEDPLLVTALARLQVALESGAGRPS